MNRWTPNNLHTCTRVMGDKQCPSHSRYRNVIDPMLEALGTYARLFLAWESSTGLCRLVPRLSIPCSQILHACSPKITVPQKHIACSPKAHTPMVYAYGLLI